MKVIKSLFLLILFVSIQACNDDPCEGDSDCPPLPIVSTKVNSMLVVNEGNFGQANGSLTLINLEDSSRTQDVVGIANNGVSTGDVVQSVYHDDLRNRLYVISNNESRILVLNDTSFVQTEIIENGLSLPRNMLSLDDKIYVTNWNSDFTNAFVAVFNANDLSEITSIDTDPGTEGIYAYGQNIFVSNNFSNTVQVIDHANYSGPVRTIKVGYAPNGMTNANIGSIHVICQDTFGGTNGYIYEIANSNLEVTDSIALNRKPNGQLLSFGGRLYFSDGSSIYGFLPNSFDSGTDRVIELSNTSIYGFDFDRNSFSSSLNFWVADAKGFTENGEVHLVNSESEILKSYEVGIGPNGFLFF